MRLELRGGWGRVWLQFLMLLYAAGGASQVRVYNLERGGWGSGGWGWGRLSVSLIPVQLLSKRPRTVEGERGTGVKQYQATPN